MAEKFLKNGDMWKFLEEVDNKFLLMNTELIENNQREDELADTFVKQVIQKRQDDFDKGFSTFTNA
eukprot:CAMPEP_0119048066 /NCGR_PEP_ID=MMETSP1177-20130426/56701_1 /TAXON_ID=2985 /ORGANISM="Ochromonas sp, Strain CCMP1899" /LENGTH=65 /DNA_ID=CAMNT_0007023457 /DNA_START=831 /DNA_END=1025 /DNA_ORIENTATION=-